MKIFGEFLSAEVFKKTRADDCLGAKFDPVGGSALLAFVCLSVKLTELVRDP